jgi:MOSC domain-containing protein YiiM
MLDDASAEVASVHLNPVHGFSKTPALEVRLLAGRGVEGDAHCAETVRHRFARRRAPLAPNLRQVHLIGTELFTELGAFGHTVRPGDLGENLTTTGIDLLALPLGTRLRAGEEAVLELTGLRTPCRLVDDFQPGLMKKLWTHGADGRPVRRAGVMAVVVAGGVVRPGDRLSVVPAAAPHRPLPPV